MRKTQVAIAVAMLLFLAAGCGGTSKQSRDTGSKDSSRTASKGIDKDGMRTFADPERAFTVKYPATWFASGSSQLAVEISSKRANTSLRTERDMTVPSVEIVAGPTSRNQSDFARLVGKSVDALVAAKPASLRGKVEPISISGGKGAWVSVEMASKSGEQVKMFMAMGGKKKMIVRIMGFSPPKDWNKNLVTFKAVAQSFRFTASSRTPT